MVLLFSKIRHSLFPKNSLRDKLARKLLQLLIKIKTTFSPAFPTWIRLNEPSTSVSAQSMGNNPQAQSPTTFTVILMCSDRHEYLEQSVESVLQQTYPYWQLLFLYRENAQKQVQKILENDSLRDERVKFVILDSTEPTISQINSVIHKVEAEFVTFLKPGDCLANFALQSANLAIKDREQVDVLYSDHDLISGINRRSNPVFKPALSIDYLRSYPYIQNILIIRKTLGEEIGWFRDGFGEAIFYDLSLRAIEKARWITHIPEILYHSRIDQNTSKSNLQIERYATAAADHLTRCDLSGAVKKGAVNDILKVEYKITGNPMVSIIIPNQDHAADLNRCIASILDLTTYQNYEILVIENNSRSQEITDLYERLVKQDKRIKIFDYAQSVFNYSRINNFGVGKSSGEILLFLNNDTCVISQNWLEEMLSYAMRPDVGAVGAKLFFSNDLIQHAGVTIGWDNGAGHYFVGAAMEFPGYQFNLLTPQNLSAVTAACMMVRKDVFREAGGFDEKYLLSYGDIDLCLKIRQDNYLNVWTPHAELYHFESRTRGFEITTKKAERFKQEKDLFLQTWGQVVGLGDPYYNPNLTLGGSGFSIRQVRCPHNPRHSKGLRISTPDS